MIKSITVTNYLGQSKKFELAHPEKSGFAIENIDGLDAPDSTILTTEVSTNDGAIFNSARTQMRNILIYFDLRFAKNIELARHETYKYFPNKKEVRLDIETDTRNCYTYGRVETNNAEIFSKNEKIQISILCPDPYLYSNEVNLTVFSGVVPVFEFPFSNESLTENLLEISILRNDTYQTVYYEGDVDCGITIQIHALGEAKNITIYNLDTREMMKINTDKLTELTGQGITAGDTITIGTTKGSKFIYLQRDGYIHNIINCLERNSNWFQITKGDNRFAYIADEGATNLQFQIENRILYEGV